ncbi:MAG TPA: hypothetical protein VGL02_31400, partial [Streptomyces sp.]
GDGQVPDASLTWAPPARNAGHPFYVRVNGDGARWVELTVRADPDLLPEEDVTTVLRTVVLGALRAVTAPDGTLGALLDNVRAAPLGADLFPRELEAAPR